MAEISIPPESRDELVGYLRVVREQAEAALDALEHDLAAV